MKRVYVLFILVPAVILLLAFTGCDTNARKASAELDTANSSLTGDNSETDVGIDIDRAVVTETVVDIFEEPDIESDRITQVLLNQPVIVLEERESWIRVETADGYTGWLKPMFIDRDCSSIEDDKYEVKVIVTAKSKVVSSQAKGGLTIKEAAMGTEFYSRYKAGDSYEIVLPGKIHGWIKESGTIEIPLRGRISETSAEDFTATLAKFKGTNYQSGGISSWGIDSSGLVYISSRINGINLPRTAGEQYNFGQKIDIEEVEQGDLIFFYNRKDSEEISEVGVYMGNNEFIHANKDKGYVMYTSLDSDNYMERIAGIRRVF